MTTIVTLFALALVLFALELFVPGFILALLGTVLMVIGTTLAFLDYGTWGGALAFTVAAIVISVVIFLELKVLPRTSLFRVLSMRATVQGTSQPPPAVPEVVGKVGSAATALAPSGVVVIEGRRYEASSQSGFLDRGREVRVVGLDGFQLIVVPT